ncbi:hypothetical protein PoB_000287100 [Plakobranchus ocellatus]|uniref:Uncharacterized protein n=1 Tax=Plakobranchus ocellatus TaxID=259542 RepID=A0AAV3XZW2_9GAST|nr:hypothetical protein PoB_000287100 [Plakobranchus ocellatus]
MSGWSGGSSGRAVGYQISGPGFESQSGENKGGEESNGKLPHNAVCQEQSGPYSWLPDVREFVVTECRGVGLNLRLLGNQPTVKPDNQIT